MAHKKWVMSSEMLWFMSMKRCEKLPTAKSLPRFWDDFEYYFAWQFLTVKLKLRVEICRRNTGGSHSLRSTSGRGAGAEGEGLSDLPSCLQAGFLLDFLFHLIPFGSICIYRLYHTRSLKLFSPRKKTHTHPPTHTHTHTRCSMLLPLSNKPW